MCASCNFRDSTSKRGGGGANRRGVTYASPTKKIRHRPDHGTILTASARGDVDQGPARGIAGPTQKGGV